MQKQDAGSSDSESWSVRLRSSPTFIIAAVCLGLFTDAISVCSIIPVLPSMLSTRAGVREADVQFYVSVFMSSWSVTFLIASPISGFLSDRLPTKKVPFICGMITSICSLVLFMRATSVVSMIFARTLQGISSAVILVIGTALIKDTLSAKKTGKGMAFTTAASQLGLITGPAFGGLIYESIGYEAVFVTPAVLLAVDIVLRLLIIERPVTRLRLLDSEGDCNESNTSDVGEREPLIGKRSKTVRESFPVLYFFSNGRMMTAFLVTFFDALQWGAVESTLPYFVMRKFDWTASNAGTMLLIGVTPGILLSYMMGSSIDRSGSLLPAAFGISVGGACHFLQRLVQYSAIQDKVLLTVFFTTCNVAMLFVQITMSAEVGLAAQEIGDRLGSQNGRLVGQAYGLYMMVQSFGQLLGPIIGGAMIEATGWAGMTTLLGSFCFAVLPGVLLYTGGGIAAWREKRAEL